VRFFNTALAIIVAVLVVLFAVSNRAQVDITLWPFPFQLTLGLYAVILLAVLVGFLAGLIAAWLSGGVRRRERRQLKSQVRDMEQSLARHKQAAEKAGHVPPV
jgi:uncharacterized integral membrane protein